MKVILSRQRILYLYCHLFQAERSVACGLGAPWADLRDYFQGERLAHIQELSERLFELGGGQQSALPNWTREQVGALEPSVGLFKVLFGRYLSRLKNSWAFPQPVIQFIHQTLACFVRLLASPRQPDQEQLIALRTDLCCCRSYIEALCYEMAELNKAQKLEHFWQAPWMTPVHLSDIIGTNESLETRPASPV